MARANWVDAAKQRGELPQASIRIIGIRRDAYVEFEFSLGDKTLTIELILPFAAFAEYRARYQAKILPPKPEIAEAIERLSWRLRRPDLFTLLGYTPHVVAAGQPEPPTVLQ